MADLAVHDAIVTVSLAGHPEQWVYQGGLWMAEPACTPRLRQQHPADGTRRVRAGPVRFFGQQFRYRSGHLLCR